MGESAAMRALLPLRLKHNQSDTMLMNQQLITQPLDIPAAIVAFGKSRVAPAPGLCIKQP